MMDRRAFLKTASSKKIAATPGKNLKKPYRTLSGLNPYTGPWTANEVQHLLKRTMFGSTKADIDYFKTRTLSQAVNELLSPTAPLSGPPLNDYSPGTPDANVTAGQTWVNDFTDDGTLNFSRNTSFKKWWVGNMINQDRSIREKLSLFWSNHFGTETGTIGLSYFVYRHHNMFRQDALGNFKQLVKSVTIDPGMLIYLNGYLNSASAPDENYARELMELFTLGKDPAVKYTEDDVRKAARVLTGWRISPTTYITSFDPAEHDSGDKQFSSYFGNTVVTGQAGAAGGDTELDALLDMIFARTEVSEFICRRLYRWFLYYEIDAATEANVIAPLATIFRNNNYDIKPVLSALFKSEHFFDVLNQGCQIKSPVDHIVGCMREFGVVFPDAVTEYADTYQMWGALYYWAALMNQDLGDPPNVSGWPEYYQIPNFHEIWITSDTLPKRNIFTDVMTYNGYTSNNKTMIIDTVAFTQTLPNPADPTALVNDLLSIIYRVPMSDQAKQNIKQQILLSGQTADYYWTNAWNAFIADTTDMTNYNIISTRLKSLFRYLMDLSEYQLS